MIAAGLRQRSKTVDKEIMMGASIIMFKMGVEMVGVIETASSIILKVYNTSTSSSFSYSFSMRLNVSY